MAPIEASAPVAMDTWSYTAIFLPEPDGGFTVFVPALPEVCGTGVTLQEAEEAARESIALALEVRREVGDPFPADSTSVPVKLLSVGLPAV